MKISLVEILGIIISAVFITSGISLWIEGIFLILSGILIISLIISVIINRNKEKEE